MLRFAIILVYASTAGAWYRPYDLFKKFILAEGHDRIDSFDDVNGKTLANFESLGGYGDLDYTGLGEFNPFIIGLEYLSASPLELTPAEAVAKASELSSTLGIVPKSTPNTIYYGGLNVLSPSSEAKISLSELPGYYFEHYFKPHSFWLGCLTVSAIPASCTVTVTSYQVDNWQFNEVEPADTQVFKFQPSSNALSVGMTQATFRDNFTFVHGLVFKTVFDTVELLGMTLLDDFNYTYNIYYPY